MNNSPNIEIKEATHDDYEAMKQLGMQCYDSNIDPNRNYRLVRFLFLRYFSKRKFKQRQQDGVMIGVAYKAKQLVGFYELEKSGLLSSLYILPEGQGKGYGKALLSEAIKQAKILHLTTMKLDASEYAKDFYLHHGFVQSEKKRQVLGITMIPMHKKL